MKIIGIVRKQGEYQGKKYDNVNLHCVSDFPDNIESDGSMTDVIKVRYDLFYDSDISVGDDITVFYDKYGRVSEIRKE